MESRWMRSSRRGLAAAFALLLALAAAACGSSERAKPRALSERGRDSTIGASVLPGAATVGRALEESDSAAARARRMDEETAEQP